MAGDKLSLDDDGFALLGNSLLLGYMVQVAGWYFNQRTLRASGASAPRDGRKAEQEREEASERVELRDVLESAGFLGDWAYGPFDLRIESAVEPLDVAFKRCLETAASDTAIAHLRLKDVAITDGHLMILDLAHAHKAADPYELRTPLARLGPTALTRRVKDLVLQHLRQPLPSATLTGMSSLYTEAIRGGGPRSLNRLVLEKRAVSALTNLHMRSSGTRLSRADAISALVGAHLSRRAAARVWENGAPKAWKQPGKIPGSVTRFTANDLAELLA